MKNKGSVIFIAVVLALTCIYQLSYTYVVRKFETEARAFATKDNKFDGEKYREYIDSLGNKEILNLGFIKKNYFKSKETELKLGLDLQGGMNVILEVSKGDVLKTLAGKSNSNDNSLKLAIEKTQATYQKSGGDFVSIFAKNFKEIAPNRSLASLFSNRETKQITSSSSDNEVVDYLQREIKSKSDNTRQVIEARLSSGSISQPNIQELEGGRISVELPGVDNPKRIRKLLEESARLEFWEVYGNNPKNEFYGYKKIYEPMNFTYAQKLSLNTGLSPEDSLRIKNVDTIIDLAVRDSVKNAIVKEINQKDSSKFPFAEAGLYPYQDSKGNIAEGPVFAIAEKRLMNKINKMLEDEAVVKNLPRNLKFAWGAEPLSKGTEVYPLYALKGGRDGEASMGSGDENMIADAFPTNNPNNGRVEVSMSMTSKASKDWKNLTTLNVGQYIAIVLDNKVFSAPVVNDPITGGQSSISGSFSVEDATDLANVLKAGKLPAPAQIVAEDVVGPTLGKESIAKGFNSFIIGLIAVILIMIFYYSNAGLVAVVAVLANIFFIIGMLASGGAALTLPGIAGIVLTIGMAVDSNVLIYERIREELRDGKTLKLAVSNGYKAALSSIVDANITTLLAGIIMLFVGAGPVYGFAITLIIGIVTSLFTSILISRIIIENRLNKGKSVKFFTKSTENILINANYNFIGNRKKFYIVSSIIIIIGMGVLIAKGGLSTGIDFKGGYGYQMQLTQGANVTSLKNALDKSLKGSSNEVKTIGSEGRFKIVTTYKINDAKIKADDIQAEVIEALKPFGATEASILSSSEVGPTIASNIRTKSMWVVIASLVVIFIYIIIRFKKVSFALGATAALFHDVLMVFSLFALLDGIVPFSIEIDQAFIAAILTVVGYSINDSVVVFDRIREFMTEFRSETNMGKLINNAINKTLSRTLLTSGTTLIVILCLFVFGGEALKGFSLALLIGVGVGTYSSICIAAPIVVDLFKKKA
jgi:SecD/SecF fusion protein